MRRKLINWEAFERIQKDSLSAAEHELLEASDLLARGLGIDQLELDCYSDSNVVYETLDGTFVRADYNLDNDHLTFENIEELVVDEETAATANKKKIFDMVEAILSNENDRAKNFLGEYMSSPVVRKSLLEGRMPGFIRDKVEARKAGKSKSRFTGSSKRKNQKRMLDAKANPNTIPREERREGKGPKDDANYFKKKAKEYKKQGRKRKTFGADGSVKITKHMKECVVLAENVKDYVAYQQYGPVLKESAVRRDTNGNVVAIRIPTLKVRNENQILTLNHKHQLDNEVKVVRESAHKLSHDMMFCRQVAELKRQNNLSDGEGLQESLSNLVGQWPSVLYLSQTELATMIGEALNVVGVSNYDDSTCTFMAEGILRTAHEVFGDKVEKILRLASAQVQVEGDQYAHFQDVVHQFYPTLDESYEAQMQIFKDLFRAVNEVWSYASEAGDSELVSQAGSILEDLHAVCRGEMSGDMELAEQVAEWLSSYVESNLQMSDWEVSNTPYTTLNGEHPAMAEKAKKGYSPSADFGDDAEKWHDRATEKQFQGPQWTSVGGDGVYPNLSNPYTPKPFGDYTMNGETGVEKDWKNGEGTWMSDDTWPNLQNPYIPKAENWKNYKMKNGPETDLVQDR